MTDWADLVLHPVRMRVLRALARGGRTTRELADALPDVPQASLYRHLAALTRGGITAITEERKVRGTTERVYALAPGATTIPAAQLAKATAEDHGRYFTAFVSTLLADFSRYLERGEPDLAADGVGYRSVVLHLNDAELAAFAASLAGVIAPLLGNTPGGGRVARQFSTVLMPVDEEGN